VLPCCPRLTGFIYCPQGFISELLSKNKWDEILMLKRCVVFVIIIAVLVVIVDNDDDDNELLVSIMTIVSCC